MLNNNDNVNKESIIQQKSLELPLSGKERFLDETLGNRRLHSARTHFPDFTLPSKSIDQLTTQVKLKSFASSPFIYNIEMHIFDIDKQETWIIPALAAK